MLDKEVYYLKKDSHPGRWWFAILRRGRLGQIIERLILRRCRAKQEAYKQADEALVHMKGKLYDEQ